jgi:hypothetical protein
MKEATIAHSILLRAKGQLARILAQEFSFSTVFITALEITQNNIKKVVSVLQEPR